MPKLNVSGYRGIWGKDLDEQIAYEYGRAFAKFIKGNTGKKILVGRDARKTGGQIFSSLESAFKAENVEIEYAGILPTPSMLFLVKNLGYDGGIMITASHNPPEYNGLKFINNKGLFTDSNENEVIANNKLNLTDQEKILVPFSRDLNNFDNKKFRTLHINKIIENVDADLIRSKKFKVAHDPINSAGSIITLELLEGLGCEVFQINKEQNGEFAHMPEPLAPNLSQISQTVSEHHADVGFAQDPDADRLVVIDEQGTIIFEEYTLALAVHSVLSKETGTVVTNLSSSRTNESIAESFGMKTYYSKVGEANVVALMQEKNAIVGGEGGGGVIYPKINNGRDSLVGIALTLELMARENKKISEIVEALPRYFMKKSKMPLTGDLVETYDKLKKVFIEAMINESDGIRFDFNDKSWIQVRPSNTEPIIRIMGEAETEGKIDALFEKVNLTLGSQ